MCGVFGFVSSEKQPGEQVISGLRSLEYRGYDSWGVVTLVDDGDVPIRIVKDVGPVPKEVPPLFATYMGLGHTRWTTHGGVTVRNAHPHANESETIAVVHNGIIENHVELRDRLSVNHTFISETDSEILPHLYEDMKEKYSSPREAFQAMFQELTGLNAVVLLDTQAGKMFVAKQGSPLVIGVAEDSTYIASDALAFAPYTDRAIFLEDFWGAEITKKSMELFDLNTGKVVKTDPVTIEYSADTDQSLQGFPNYTEKEISKQPTVLKTIAQHLSLSEEQEKLESVIETLRSAKSIYMTACGTAFHAAQIGSYWLSAALDKKVWPILGSELANMLPWVDSETVVLVLSQSGETIDVVEPVTEAKKLGASIISFVNVPYSTLYRLADTAVVLQAGPERAVASTKSFTAKLAWLWSVAQHMMGTEYDSIKKTLYRLSEHSENMLAQERQQRSMRSFAQRYQSVESMFIIGNGLFSALAREIALKIKEISYIHAEGLQALELKHGTLALIEPGVSCVVLAGEAKQKDIISSSAQEVVARGGQLFCIGEALVAGSDHVDVDTHDLGRVLETAFWGQILAYELTLQRGLDPDKPRNLAKSVTVK